MKQVDVLRNYVSEANVQAGFITTPDNVFYLSSFQSEPHERLLGIMVFPEEEPFLICPRMEVPDAKAAGWPYEIVGYSDTEDAWTVLWESVRKRGIAPSSVAIEKSHLTVDRFERMQELFPNAEFKSLDGQLNEMRVIKSEEELTNMRKAAELADLAIHIGCEEIAEGKTELEILMKVEYEMMKRGAEKMAFETMVLSGPKTASPHGKPGDRKIQQGDFILFDLGSFITDIVPTLHGPSLSVNRQMRCAPSMKRYGKRSKPPSKLSVPASRRRQSTKRPAKSSRTRDMATTSPIGSAMALESPSMNTLPSQIRTSSYYAKGWCSPLNPAYMSRALPASESKTMSPSLQTE